MRSLQWTLLAIFASMAPAAATAGESTPEVAVAASQQVTTFFSPVQGYQERTVRVPVTLLQEYEVRPTGNYFAQDECCHKVTRWAKWRAKRAAKRALRQEARARQIILVD